MSRCPRGSASAFARPVVMLLETAALAKDVEAVGIAHAGVNDAGGLALGVRVDNVDVACFQLSRSLAAGFGMNVLEK